MTDRVLVDTNVLVYAYDLDQRPKRERAAFWLDALWASKLGVLSTQVLQEFYSVTTRKLKPPLDASTAQAIVEAYGEWNIVLIDVPLILDGIAVSRRHQLSFWDALIIASAIRGEATTLLTEDLSHGQVFDSVRVVNPFLTDELP
ncbi:MAG: PIN domain-containing protein [bacterium]